MEQLKTAIRACSICRKGFESSRPDNPDWAQICPECQYQNIDYDLPERPNALTHSYSDLGGYEKY
jgi:hypothetical protein